MKEGQCGWRVGRRASIDKLLPVLDRYDWMPAVMNTKQDDISFLTIFVYILYFRSLDLRLPFSIEYMFVLFDTVSETKGPAVN